MDFSRVLNQFAQVGSSTLLTLLYDQLLIESTSWGEICPSSSSFSLGNSASTSKSAEHGSEFSSPGTSSNENGGRASSSSSSADASLASSSVSNMVVNMLIKPSKTCPDFKDDLDQSACCPSQINHGAYFCCTEEYRQQLQWELDREAWRQFVRSHILEIVIGSVLLVISLIIVATVLCKRLTFCPMHRSKMLRPTDTTVASFHGFGANRYSFASSGRYHHHHRPLISNYAFQQQQQVTPIQQQQQQAAVVHKPPPFEAPPPYDFVTAPRYDSGIESVDSSSGRLMNATGGGITTTQRTENWNYLTENEINDIHEAASDEAANRTMNNPDGDDGAAIGTQISVPTTMFSGSC